MYPHIHHQPNQPILDVKHLGMRYNGRVALEDITFHLHEANASPLLDRTAQGKAHYSRWFPAYCLPPLAR